MRTFDFAPDATTGQRLKKFVDLLMDWNRVHNLTGAKTREAVEAQVEDSLYPLTFLPHAPKSLLDIGTGAGFPGLVLACAWSECDTTLCEPLQKRAAFLRYAARELGLDKVTVEAKRVEALAPRPYDLVTSRAVTETKELVAWCRPFVGETTQLLFYKGERAPEEVAGLERCDIALVARGKRNYLWIKDPEKC
ncbi:16S rRNA (guanine(527)-N(7))-methyltransferase RsmG [Hydrogenimonas sp.]